MMDVQIPPNMILWENREGMIRRNVKINMNVSTIHANVVKETMDSVLSNNLQKKMIVYANTSTKDKSVQYEIDSYLNECDIVGNTALVIGELDPNIKFITSPAFTEVVSDPEDKVNNHAKLKVKKKMQFQVHNKYQHVGLV